MQAIAVAELEKDWINFGQLLQRWNIKENLLASYCVCVDTSRGNPPLSPHFYQGAFPVPGGGTWKKLAKYEPEYKNAAHYLNKNKTESQLVQEFLHSISNIKKDTIWFPLSSVEELEGDDYSLAAAAQSYLKASQRLEKNTSAHPALSIPIPQELNGLVDNVASPQDNTSHSDAPVVSHAKKKPAAAAVGTAPMPQHGSNKRTDEINATTAACLIVIGAILNRSHLDDDGKINRDGFEGLVRDTMNGKGQGSMYHATTAKNKFANSPELANFKRPVGRQKN